MRIFILSLTYREAQQEAQWAGIRAADWIFLDDPYKLMGYEKPQIVRTDRAEMRQNYRQIFEVAESRSARWFTAFDLQEGRV